MVEGGSLAAVGGAPAGCAFCPSSASLILPSYLQQRNPAGLSLTPSLLPPLHPTPDLSLLPPLHPPPPPPPHTGGPGLPDRHGLRRQLRVG